MRCIAADAFYFGGISRVQKAQNGLRASMIRFNKLGAPNFMSGLRARSACVAMMLAALAPLLAGCDESISAASAAPPSDPDVSIVIVKPQSRAVVRELPGRIAPTRVSDVRPRVSGIVVERLFRQGSEVKAGDALYRIDPRPFEVEVLANEAALAKAEAAAMQAHQQARRVAALTKDRAAPEAENEKAIAAERQAHAEVEGRKAELARAKLNLDYATVRAPIDGVVGAALVSEGALVVQNETNLATIQQLDPIYADFTQSVNELNQLRRAFETGDLERIASDAAKVRLVLDDNTTYALDGKLLFSDAKVDAHTGQVTLRGQFPNPKRELLPGMYVRVRIDQGLDSDAIAVPQQAIQRNGGGGSEVFVVKDDNHIAVQAVRTGSVQDGLWFVTEGLKAGDKVVVEGFQKFAAGDKVKPQSWSEADATADNRHAAQQMTR
ncbi:membrane fusion protein (multidrug efflux system) [Bradyrhizobium daqingense]|uniref:Membrane fusion protein (Multidrug efflux system) n=2 Tax=Bradyrhizobium daqingense TaxID=993502 RepID=A0A562LHU0_9BRAD|nr:membrane fusion protein (multidrug efflux system) [Bradyrhizobium daqingense]